MQELLEKITDVAKNLHRKNQANIASASLDETSYELAQQMSRSSLIGLFLMISINRNIAEAIVDVEIIGGRKVLQA